jgi:hypothetical protein
MAVGVGKRVRAHVEYLHPVLELLERGRNILAAPDFKPVDFETERVRHGQNLAHFLHRPGIAGIAEPDREAELLEHSYCSFRMPSVLAIVTPTNLRG